MIVRIDDDFDLYKIAYSGQCFRVKEAPEGGFSFVTGKNRVTVKACGNEYDVSCTRTEWDNIWRDYFDLDTDYAAIRAMIPKDDAYLKRSADIGKGIRILKQDKFEMLISFIISQRKSIPAIRTSVERICDLCGENGFFPEMGALAALSYEELSGCGLGYRVPYVMDAAKKAAYKEVDLEEMASLSDEELFDELKEFKGVGDKVANCVALFAYHRIGRAPVDTWIKKIIDTEYNGVNPFEGYGKYAGVMQQYMFYSAQHMKEL